jgi:transketolase
LRQALIHELSQLAASDPRIILLTGDLGFMVMEPFKERFPQRFINAGVAEQNMMAVATGLAEAGLRPYVYSIAPFAALRTFEFIRNGPVLHGLPVRIVGMGAGFEYGHAGSTHYALEDVGALRTLPGLTIVAPADSAQAAAAIRVTAELAGPVYYSLSKDDQITVPHLDGRFTLGRLAIIGRGKDVAIVSSGSLSVEAAAAVEILAGRGVAATHGIVSSYNPDPEEDLAYLLAGFHTVISVEAQTLSGGLAAFVGSVIASRGLGCRLRPIAVRRSPDGRSGSQADRWRSHELDRTAIVERVLGALERTPS